MLSFLSEREKDKSLANGEESAKLTIMHLGLSFGSTTLLKGLWVKKGHKLLFWIKFFTSSFVERFLSLIICEVFSLLSSTSIMISKTALLSP